MWYIILSIVLLLIYFLRKSKSKFFCRFTTKFDGATTVLNGILDELV